MIFANEFYELFSKIPTQLFYTYDNDISTIRAYKDDKIILVIYILYIYSGLNKRVLISINKIITIMEYYNNTTNKDSIKNILHLLDKLQLINVLTSKYNASDLIEIDTAQLINYSDKYITLYQNELIKIKENTKNNKELLNILKLYLYLKSRCYNNNDNIQDGGRSKTTFQSYKDIHKFIGIAEGTTKDYINKLQSIGLITYINIGYICKGDNIKLASNLYTINNIHSEPEEVQLHLKEGRKQQEYYYNSKGYTIIKAKENKQLKKLNGEKGSIIKKMKNKQFTITEVEQLEKVNDKIKKLKKNIS